MVTYAFYNSPFGLLKTGTAGGKVILITLVPKQDVRNQPTSLSEEVFAQLQAYFAGRRTEFSLPYELIGTTFQKQVWAQIAKIPYGKTAAYKDIAEAIEKPRAFQATGRAVGANPLPIIIPCHRVIGSNGTLTGYALGLEMKKALLKLEQGLAIPTFSSKPIPCFPTTG
ncbi:methylated-DNA--[protein]-cysteine S-methyltransferase [Selenomonas sp. AE3005]|uniref:methylated-DNA--[protein]-cysteine S-methyltransferase n=1 Tax=Selenomonas sp. AE3005 TaxID=1485543 RepID=UPI00068C09D0|nr:methylated-DNA--[protein]-cysteine S-methyltransferase [Selenomonas sp. AE3005]